jgi:hypothetical protein
MTRDMTSADNNMTADPTNKYRTTDQATVNGWGDVNDADKNAKSYGPHKGIFTLQ